MSSQYMILPSNASFTDFPDNTNAQYTVKLSERLNFEPGLWEVALADMHYSNSWVNVTEGLIEVHKEESNGSFSVFRVEIQKGRIGTMLSLSNRIRRAMNSMQFSRLLTITTDAYTRKSHMIIQGSLYKLKLSSDLATIYGFDSEKYYYEGTHHSTKGYDINAGFRSIYVYSDIVKPRPVGDVSAPLLRVVPISDSRSSDIYKEFRQLHYSDVAKTDSSLIQVSLHRDDGEPIPFFGGKVSLTLHFRKKELY